MLDMLTTRSGALVDPELLSLLNALPVVTFAEDSLPEMRSALAEKIALAPVDASPVLREELWAPRRDGSGDVRILAYRPVGQDGPVAAFLHIHGGGFVIGSADMNDTANRQLAHVLNCAIFSVDYRLAPETRYPGSVEDCYSVLAWVTANAERLGIDPARLGVKGESAGGGLAAALAILVRDRGELSLAFQHLIHPMLDDRTAGGDDHPYAGEFVWTKANIDFGWRALLGDDYGGAGVPQSAAPARAEDLAGLPPAYVAVGALDLLVDEGIDYARRLNRAGVPIELHVYPGAFHGFNNAPQAHVAIAAERNSREALARAMHAGATE